MAKKPKPQSHADMANQNNKPFHPSHYNRQFWNRFTQRGAIVEVPPFSAGGPKGGSGPTSASMQVKRLNFQFNPAEIAVGYTISMSELPADSQSPEQLAVTPLYPQPITLSFQMLFDRTLDVAAGKVKTGVGEDIRQFESIIGYPHFTGNGRTFKTTDLQETRLSQPILTLKAVDFFFGSAQGAGPLRFRGYITSATVSYTLFAWNMVPLRCLLVVYAQQQIIGENAGLNNDDDDSPSNNGVANGQGKATGKADKHTQAGPTHKPRADE